MSWYRETYLKSPEWKATRAASISQHDSTCCLCREKKESLDVHHLSYKNLFCEKLSEIRPVCRECHDKVHELFEKFPKLKKLPPREQWRIVQTHLHKHKSEFRPKREKLHHRKYGQRNIEFGICRNVLSEIGLIVKSKMKWRDELGKGSMNRNSPILFLYEYIRVTNIDPRVPIYKSSPHRLLTW